MAQTEQRLIPNLIKALEALEVEAIKAEVRHSGPMARKKELLDHYEGKSINAFIQVDGNANVPCSDADGDVFFIKLTHELMCGADVRILIRPGTPMEVVFRIMGKIQSLLQQEREERKKALRAEAAGKISLAKGALTIGQTLFWGNEELEKERIIKQSSNVPF